MTGNPFDLFVDRYDKDHPVPTELSDEDLSKLSDEELIERTNAISLTTAYIEITGVRSLKNMFDVLLEIAYHSYLPDKNDEDIIDWGPKEIAELGITVGQLKVLLDLIWKHGVCPCLKSCSDLQSYLWDPLRSELCKRRYWDRGVHDTTVVGGLWTHFPKDVKE